MNVVIQADKDNDQCYLSFGKDILGESPAASTIRVSEDLILDFDSEGRLIGLDVMNASSVFGEDYDKVRIDALVGVKEAAQLLGVRPSNFVRDYADKAGFPEPVSELASGRIWLQSQVLGYAKAKQRRPLAG